MIFPCPEERNSFVITGSAADCRQGLLSHLRFGVGTGTYLFILIIFIIVDGLLTLNDNAKHVEQFKFNTFKYV